MAKHMLMTGVALDAERALALGPRERASTPTSWRPRSALAGALADGPPLAISAAKRLVDAGPELPFADGGRRSSATPWRRSSTPTIGAEGLAAFKAKRAPVFTGR